ncbi:MAG: efflux RND transporter periplasmic adaptor subunit [Azospirillaceae bacterium]|nr:efflux RND transporter periplasmic adaptor subunit [Azospirillaceae bacterium]
MTRRILLFIAAIVVVGGGIRLIFGGSPHPGVASALTLYGNVDLRQVDLPFNESERIDSVLVQEGDHVTTGQVLARLSTRRLDPQVAQAAAEAAAQQAAVDRLHHGSRPEEIAEARANVDSARADVDNTQRQFERQRKLSSASGGRAGSIEDLDNARAAFDVATAKAVAAQKAADLAAIGPRKEDIAQAEAQLRADQAHLAWLEQQLSDAILVAPTDAVVRSRLMEAGEIASPQRPVFSLAVIDPKWVRAYVAETDLGKIRPGAPATVTVDSFAGHPFTGWVGFISPVAEFTPKAVETTELRTSLVYEVRVFVKDPDDQLRLGMPATVSIENEPAPAPAPPAPPAASTPGARS